MKGNIRWFDELKGEGLIRGEDGQSYFISHYSVPGFERAYKRTDKQIERLGELMYKGREVEFSLIEDSHYTMVDTLEFAPRQVDMGSIVLSGVDTGDYPKFVDAYISEASWEDGQELTDRELDDINEDSDLIHELVSDYIQG